MKPSKKSATSIHELVNPATLRDRAERKVATAKPNAWKSPIPQDALQVIHELEVHQIELEMQNEQLRQTQAALEVSRAQYFDIYDHAPVGYFNLGEKGVILKANLAAANLLDVTRGELVKQRLDRFILPADQDIYYLCSKQPFETGTLRTCELRMQRKNASPVWVRMEATGARDADGVSGCLVVVIDNSARKVAELALQMAHDELEQRVQERTNELARMNQVLQQREESALRNSTLLRTIIESPVDIIIFALDTHYRYTMFAQEHKRTVKAIWGVDIEVGMNMLDAITNLTDREKARKNFDRALKGESFIEIEECGDAMLYRTIYKDRYSPIIGGDGVVLGLTVFVSDMTERMALEEEIINISEREQCRIGEELHDGLGQQLTAIELMCSSLQKDLPASLPELKEMTAQMRQFMREAIRQIRMLAHDLTGFEITTHGLPDALTRLAQTISLSGRVECRFVCPEPVSFRDTAVADHLYRITQEAVNNAVKHANASLVTIHLTQQEEVSLRISDDGKGFSNGLRLPTGMGLQVMKHRANRIGAQLKVESNAGQGVTVTCTLQGSRLEMRDKTKIRQQQSSAIRTTTRMEDYSA